MIIKVCPKISAVIIKFLELLKQIKPCVENDILKIVTGQPINELTDETLFAANDAFMKRGTTVKLVPSSQKGCLILSLNFYAELRAP